MIVTPPGHLTLIFVKSEECTLVRTFGIPQIGTNCRRGTVKMSTGPNPAPFVLIATSLGRRVEECLVLGNWKRGNGIKKAKFRMLTGTLLELECASVNFTGSLHRLGDETSSELKISSPLFY